MTHRFVHMEHIESQLVHITLDSAVFYGAEKVTRELDLFILFKSHRYPPANCIKYGNTKKLYCIGAVPTETGVDVYMKGRKTLIIV